MPCSLAQESYFILGARMLYSILKYVHILQKNINKINSDLEMEKWIKVPKYPGSGQKDGFRWLTTSYKFRDGH